MKSILCYGDSNTWGYIPGMQGKRYDFDTRWPGILQKKLGDEYTVIEEGLNSRTTAFDDPICVGRNGLKTLAPIILSHSPLDLIIIMLGTNDYKDYLHSSNYATAEAYRLYCHEIRGILKSENQPIPKILLVSPIQVENTVLKLDEEFNEESISRSKEIAKRIEIIAKENDAYFFDAAQVSKASETDGLHMEPQEHEKLALAMEKKIKEIL